MKQTNVILFIILLVWGVTNAQVDPFYLQALEAGKKLVLQAEYEEAIERFDIAAFGLMEEGDVLSELYLYTVFSYYKLEQFDDVRETMKKLKALAGDVDSRLLPTDSAIAEDMRTMLVELNYIKKNSAAPKKKTPSTPRVEPKPKPKPKTKTETEQLDGFDDVLRLIKNKQLKEGARLLKKLKRKHRKDPRIFLLEGQLSFYGDDYEACIERLLSIYSKMNGPDRDEASYYLVLSYYFEKNYGQALAFYQKIDNPQTKRQLKHIYEKIVSGRQADIDRLAANFSIGELDKLVSMFAGDQFLCESIFRRVLDVKKGNDALIESVIYGCLRFPQAINGDFIVLAATYLNGLPKKQNAIKLLKKYLGNRSLDEADIDVYYSLGKFLFENSNPRAALQEFSIVDKLQSGYKDSKKYMDEINRYLKNRKK